MHALSAGILSRANLGSSDPCPSQIASACIDLACTRIRIRSACVLGLGEPVEQLLHDLGWAGLLKIHCSCWLQARRHGEVNGGRNPNDLPEFCRINILVSNRKISFNGPLHAFHHRYAVL